MLLILVQEGDFRNEINKIYGESSQKITKINTEDNIKSNSKKFKKKEIS